MVAMSFRLDDELAERLHAAAFVSHRSKQAILAEALQDWLDGKGQQAIAEYRAQQASKQRKR